jgi:hypothetical protein
LNPEGREELEGSGASGGSIASISSCVIMIHHIEGICVPILTSKGTHYMSQTIYQIDSLHVCHFYEV